MISKKLCPKCQSVLREYVITTYPPIYQYQCPFCGFMHEEKSSITYETLDIQTTSNYRGDL